MITRDVGSRRLEAGRRYILTRPGSRPVAVTVTEDEHTDLWIEHNKGPDGTAVRQRVDELSPDVRFHRVSDYVSDAVVSESSDLVAQVEERLHRASEYRQSLRVLTEELCQMLRCDPCSGTHLSDLIVAAVRDGSGSAIELVDVSGVLH